MNLLKQIPLPPGMPTLVIRHSLGLPPIDVNDLANCWLWPNWNVQLPTGPLCPITALAYAMAGFIVECERGYLYFWHCNGWRKWRPSIPASDAPVNARLVGHQTAGVLANLPTPAVD